MEALEIEEVQKVPEMGLIARICALNAPAIFMPRIHLKRSLFMPAKKKTSTEPEVKPVAAKTVAKSSATSVASFHWKRSHHTSKAVTMAAPRMDRANSRQNRRMSVFL